MSNELLDLLSWNAPSQEPYRRRVEHLGTVASHLSAALGDLGRRFDRRARADAALAAVEQLPAGPLVRVLGAPECGWAVAQYHASPSPQLLDDLEVWLEVEAALSAGARGLAPQRGGWSALGDEYFTDPFAGAATPPLALAGSAPGAPSVGLASVASPAASTAASPSAPSVAAWLPWGLHARYRAPVHRGIVIDFASPTARRTPRCNDHREIKMEAPVPMTEVEQERSLKRITTAIDVLAAAAPPAYQLVSMLTRVIVPRRDGVHPDFYTSGSLRTAVGRTALNNPQAPRVTLAMLVSSLVHEAIHSYLYIDEQRRPLVTDWDRAFDTFVVSPWTGGALSVPTFLHACHVWHGLYNLWSLPALITAVGHEPALEQRQRAAAGFARGALFPIAELRDLVSPSVWHVLERMHHETLQHAA